MARPLTEAFRRHGPKAIQFADAALKYAVKSGLPSLVSEVHMSKAHGLALTDSPRQTVQALASAEDALSKVSKSNDPAWAKYLCDAYLQARTGHTLLTMGDAATAVRSAEASLDMDDSFVRGKMFNLVLLAQSLTDVGEIEQAVSVGRKSLALARQLRSRRSMEYLQRLATRLIPYRSNADVSDLVSTIGAFLAPVQQDGLKPDDRR
ncbi:hypothetical protein [Salininema proteolyticum]|uniref:MalT-like TPR region domain-containing protein n=1 Tax=Salininema proteolyticum TaxID=1607685 RepID=A0ABV8TVZ2_9ACTN